MKAQAVTREAARAELHRLAETVREVDHGAAVDRLLERVASSGAPELHAVLLEAGAAAVLREGRR